ncbi:hypothetical protein DV735_g965, partial [Chaetothyriales sp. CBS 134920]
MADSEAILEDYSHQGCYVFQPPATNGTKDQGHKPELNRHPDLWPRLCAGSEPEELAVLRHDTYQRLWKEVEARIDAVIDAVDDEALPRIRHFVRSAVPPRGQLTTALLLSGAQGRRQMQELLRNWSQGSAEEEVRTEVFVQLPAHQCPNLPTALKTLIRLAINNHAGSVSTDHYAAFIAANKRLIPMAFDLELLHRYLVQQRVSRVVVALPEIESFDVSLVTDLVHHLSLWSDRIPFSLVLGVSTTIDLFESRLPKATIRLLHAQPFSLSPHADPLYPILQAIHESSATSLFLGPSVLGFLAESTHNQSTTPPALKRIIKYAFMSHFFANPLSILLCDKAEYGALHKPTNQSFLASLLRNTPSFRTHCSDLVLLRTRDAAERVRQLLTSDADVLDHSIFSLTDSTDYLRSGYTAIDAFVQLYTYPSLGLNTPPTPASELYVQLSQHLLPGPKTKALETTSLFSDLKSTLAAHRIPEIINKLNTFPQAMGSCASVTDLATAICPPSVAQDPSSPIPLLEICTFALRHPLQATFAPRPRHAIERALSRPSDYLGCDCCADEPGRRASLGGKNSRTPGADVEAQEATKEGEPTSLLYTLICEAGRHVNLRDFLHHRGLALFYRALAELKMLGLVQHASSSTLPSAVTAAAARSARVDIVARSTWPGL